MQSNLLVGTAYLKAYSVNVYETLIYVRELLLTGMLNFNVTNPLNRHTHISEHGTRSGEARLRMTDRACLPGLMFTWRSYPRIC